MAAPPKAKEHEPRVPASITDVVRKVSFPELEALVASHFLEHVHEALENADGMLQRRVRGLSPGQRERVRAASMLPPEEPPKLPPRYSKCKREAAPGEAEHWRWLSEGLGR